MKLSDESFHYENLSLIKQLLLNNDYSEDLVNLHIKETATISLARSFLKIKLLIPLINF